MEGRGIMEGRKSMNSILMPLIQKHAFHKYGKNFLPLRKSVSMGERTFSYSMSISGEMDMTGGVVNKQLLKWGEG